MTTPVARKTGTTESAAENGKAQDALVANSYRPDKSLLENLPRLGRDTSFWGMAATQFLGAFNDNLFKQLILLLATPTAAELLAHTAKARQSTAMNVFAVPFLLFSGVAGYVSDRISK